MDDEIVRAVFFFPSSRAGLLRPFLSRHPELFFLDCFSLMSSRDSHTNSSSRALPTCSAPEGSRGVSPAHLSQSNSPPRLAPAPHFLSCHPRARTPRTLFSVRQPFFYPIAVIIIHRLNTVSAHRAPECLLFRAKTGACPQVVRNRTQNAPENARAKHENL